MKKSFSTRTFYTYLSRHYCTKQSSSDPDLQKSRSHAARIHAYFRSAPHLTAIKKYIPKKYLQLKRKTIPDNLYLVDEDIARRAASHIFPIISKNDDQIISETSPGLGLIATELLDKGIKLIRLYEPCPEFREALTEFDQYYKGRVEIFTKNIFHLSRYEYMDKQDHGNRVEQLLKGLPRKNWIDDPAMTIIGSLYNSNFIRFLTKCLLLQNHIITNGRFELFAFMRPGDYVVLTAGPHLNLHTYQTWSVIFNVLYDYELLDKFPRKAFLPWESHKEHKFLRYPNQIDPDQLYFVRIAFKKDFPLTIENLLPFYSFVTQFFGKGTKRIVPILEKWVPGSGLDAMVPKLNHDDYFKNLNIFTQFGELTPQQILHLFKEMITHPTYNTSPFMAMVESQLIKSETIETALDESLEKSIAENIEIKE